MFRNFLSRLFGIKSISTMQETWKNNTPAYPEASFENNVRFGWRRNELIFACINKTANTAAQMTLQVLQDQTDEVYDNHPMKRLIQRPNKFMSEFDFWYSVIVYLKLSGRAVYEKVRNEGGFVVALMPLRPDWLLPVISSTDIISKYRYAPPGLEPMDIPLTDILEFKLFDPLDWYNGYPPVSVAGRVGDVDNSATDYLKLFFEKGGTPPGIISSKQKLLDSEAEGIRLRWRKRYGGIGNWIDPAVLDSDSTYQKTGFSFQEMGFDVLDARNEARVCMVMDVPPILIGAKIGLDRSTFSNYAEARKSWWQDSLLPLYSNFLDVLINQLLPEFGKGFHVAWDLSQVAALQEEQNARWSRATAALTSGGILVNQFLEQVGLPQIGESGNVFLRSSSTIEVPVGQIRPMASPETEEEVEESDDDEDEAEDSGEEGEESDDSPEQSESTEQESTKTRRSKQPINTVHALKRRHHPDPDIDLSKKRKHLEEKLADALIKHFQEEENELLALAMQIREKLR